MQPLTSASKQLRATPPFPLCDLVTRIVGPALWDAPGLVDVPVIVGIDDNNGEAVAYEPGDCTVTARTPLLR